MFKKAIIALLTGFLIVLFIIVFCGFIIETSYTFVLMNAYWLHIEPRYILIMLLLIALVLSCFILACISNKD